MSQVIPKGRLKRHLPFPCDGGQAVVKKEPPTKKQRVLEEYDVGPLWDLTEVLANEFNVSITISSSVKRLFDEENTVPFIARYRKEQTGNMDAAQLRLFKEHYDTLRSVEVKMEKVVQTITKSGAMTPTLLHAVKSSQTLEDLDVTYAPFKLNKSSLAERARNLGLGKAATEILADPKNCNINFETYVQAEKKGLKTVSEVELGIKHIIAEHISKDYNVIESVRNIFQTKYLFVECKKSRSVNKIKADAKENNIFKFEQYFEFRRSAESIQSHQVLAINRGESLKILTVKVDIPSRLMNRFIEVTFRWLCRNSSHIEPTIHGLLESSVHDCYSRLTEPFISRRVRAELTKKAEKLSVEVFAKNLRNLLLTSAVKGHTILAIDPGFRQGCKVAVVTENGSVLYAETLYLHDNHKRDAESQKLVQAAMRHNCEIIGIGNGTACRETELLVVNLIQRNAFRPLKVSYCIIDESGVSVYSVSEAAAAEFPKMEPNLRSAVSLARRLIDPMSEYVKVDPKHLGIGMYQHDISETILKKTLEAVVQECVSFVGLDLNTASVTVLSKVAGLTKARAAAIVKFRSEKGVFMNREQLNLVPGIGQKTFEQCAGFLRICPKTVQAAKSRSIELIDLEAPKTKIKKADNVSAKLNYLDCTSIHPEAYNVATRLLKDCGCNLAEIGTTKFIKSVKNYFQQLPVEKSAEKYRVGVATMQLIADGLQQDLEYDIREEFNKPLFRSNIAHLESLHTGMILTGMVSNVTTFGLFVDVGVGRDGLVPNSRIDRKRFGSGLSVGDRISVRVINVDSHRKRLTLDIESDDLSRSSASLLR